MLTRVLSAVVALVSTTAAIAADRLVVHEWGTFTSLQDETGRTIRGINVEDEPVPDFVHSLDRMLLVRSRDQAPAFYQGAPASHPGVTMRLETPVVYFHPPPGSRPITCDVTVRFPGGWLTQFYPNADASLAGPRHVQEDPLSVRPLTAESSSTLVWRNLRIGPATHPFPQTTDRVWLSPRDVKAADVSIPAGQSERFLFYRGVAHLDAPVQISRSHASEEDTLWFQDLSASVKGPFWLVDVRDDGVMGYRRIDKIAGTPPALPLCAARFAEFEHVIDNHGNLFNEIRAELVKAGLFADEADALLNTWQLSYFKSPGQRLFFLAPRQWVDRVLPLEISVPADVTRVMVARVELVTPRLREFLARISAGPTSDGRWYFDHLSATTRAAGNPPPPARPPTDYQAYRSLGRFRDALVLDELARRPTEPLKQFVKNYGLEPRSARRP